MPTNKCNLALLLFRLENYEDLLDHQEEYSTREERREADKFASPKNKYKLLSYILRRYVLAKYLKRPPLMINFLYNDFGKPYLEDSEIDFSVSLSGKWFLMGLVKNRFVGVDLEMINYIPKLNSFINKYVSKEQKKALLTIKGYDKLVLTHLDWCMKESFMKARGFGIKDDFRSYNYIMENPEIAAESDDYKKIFTWSLDNKYLTNATSNMHFYSYDEDLALAITTMQHHTQVEGDSLGNNIIHYKVNPTLIDSDLLLF